MPLAAATHHPSHAVLWLTAAALALVWLAGYLVACRIWPFAACRKCEGAGKFRSPSGKAWRTCRRCKGSGARIRIGRRVWNWVTSVQRDASQ